MRPPKCPECGNRMVERGYPDQDFVQWYTCLVCGYGAGPLPVWDERGGC